MTPEEFVNKHKPLAFFISDTEVDPRSDILVSIVKIIKYNSKHKYPYKAMETEWKYAHLATEKEIEDCTYGSAKGYKQELIHNLREFNKMNEEKRHVHYALIEEWARTGKQVQYQDYSGHWYDWPGNTPAWDQNTAYRIKPEGVKYKRYITKTIAR